MIREYQAFFEAFKLGKEIANAVKLKKYQTASNLLGSFIASVFVIAQAFGYHLPVDQTTINTAAAGVGAIFMIFNAIATVTTSKKVGIK